MATDEFREFWTTELDGAQPMKLPRMVAPVRADKGEREIVKFEVPISPELSNAIKRLATTLAVPLKTVLLAAHIRVIGAFGGGTDVLTYTVSNGRPENCDGHGVIGLFVNSLAFRMRLSGGSWADLVRDTLRKEHDLLPYRRYPMAEVKRQSGNQPLSETLFFFNHYHVADVLEQWRDAKLLGIKVYGKSTFPYCINAYLAPVSKRLGMRIEYDSLQYSAELMAAMPDAYLTVLKAMIADPNGRYDTVSLINTADRHRIERWNATQAQFPEVLGIASSDRKRRGHGSGPDRDGVRPDSFPTARSIDAPIGLPGVCANCAHRQRHRWPVFRSLGADGCGDVGGAQSGRRLRAGRIPAIPKSG